MVQSKSDRERQKIITDKCQSLIEVLLRDDDNKYCVDCDAKGPRWASWNLGVFLCIRCAGIHRNLGVHISRVKSVNLDAWTPEHVAYAQRMGNRRARAIYEANLPDDFRRPQTDTALESFIRAKYELKKYILPGYVDPGPPAPAFSVEEEFKKMKEQKKSKSGASHVTRIVSIPTDSSVTKQPRPSDSGFKQNVTSGLIDIDSTPIAEVVSEKPGNKSALDLLIGDLSGPDDNSTPVADQNVLFNDNSNSKPNMSSAILDLDLDFNHPAPQAPQLQMDSACSNKILTKESILSLYSRVEPGRESYQK